MSMPEPSVRAMVLRDGELQEGPRGVPIAEDQVPLDSAEHEYVPGMVGGVVTAQGANLFYTPSQPSKRLRLHWIYALSKPSASAFPLVTVMLGNKEVCTTYGVSKRKRITADNPGDALVVVLDAPGNVACTFDIEELDS